MNIYNNKELVIENELLPDLGIMMSYGGDSGLVSMGLFFVGGYYDETGKKLDFLPEDKSGVEVEFIEYELDDHLQAKVKPNGNKVYMPYYKAKKLYGEAASANYDTATKLCESDLDGRDFLSLLNDTLYRVYADSPEIASGGIPGFESKSMESLDASFVSSDGHDMGVDFRVFPFLYDMIKRRYLEKNLNMPIDKGHLYNYVYALNYEIEKEKEKEIEIGGTIYEPGPNSYPLPDIYREGELERELEREVQPERHM